MRFPISTSQLGDFLPHRPPAIWVDEVQEVWIQGGRCGVRFDPEARYARGGNLSETCYAEWIAQAYGYVRVAQGIVGVSPREKVQKQTFLAAMKNFEIFERPSLPPSGTLFEVEVRESHRIGPISIVDGQVILDGRKLGTAQLKVFSLC